MSTDVLPWIVLYCAAWCANIFMPNHMYHTAYIGHMNARINDVVSGIVELKEVSNG